MNTPTYHLHIRFAAHVADRFITHLSTALSFFSCLALRVILISNSKHRSTGMTGQQSKQRTLLEVKILRLTAHMIQM